MSIKNILKLHRSNILLLIFFSIATFCSNTHANAQTRQDIVIVIDDTVGVQADWDPWQNQYDPRRLHTNITTVDLSYPGYYRINIKILYNSGDEQTNETFFMTVLSPDGATIAPVDSNAGPNKIVFDDPGPRHTAWRDAGLFYFSQGENTLQMHHVAAIMDEYPELLDGPLGESESVKVPDSLKLVPQMIDERSVDLSVSLKSKTDSVIVVDGDSITIAAPGGSVQYSLTVSNHSPNSAKNVALTNVISKFFTIENFSLTPQQTSGDTLIWEFPSLQPLSDLTIVYDGAVDIAISINDSLLIARVDLVAPNDTTAFNNSATDTVLINIPGSEPIKRSVDLGITLVSETDSVLVANGDSTNVVFPGGKVRYTLNILNHSPDSARNIILSNLVTSNFNFENISLNPSRVSGDSLVWEFSSLPPLSNLQIQIDGKSDENIPENDSLMIARAALTAANDTTADNNTAVDTVCIAFSIEKPRVKFVDLSLSLISATGFSSELNGKNFRSTGPGKNIDYTLTVFNQSPDSARDVLLTNIAPGFINVENMSINPNRVSGDSIIWEFPTMPALSEIAIHLAAVVHNDIPSTENFLIAHAYVSASNDTTENNNEAIDTVQVKFPTDFSPKIEALPSTVDVTDSIQIRIQLPEGAETWDLWIHRPDGIADKTFADQYIGSNPVIPNIWYEIDQHYTPSWLITTEKEEQLIFEIHSYDFFNTEKSAQAAVTVRSSNYLVLDRNVFRAEAEEPLSIRFKLSNRRVAQLDIYDISGRHILKITEGAYEGGWNTYPWNGMNQDGQKVGGGVYLVTLRSGEFNSWKKFILVR